MSDFHMQVCVNMGWCYCGQSDSGVSGGSLKAQAVVRGVPQASPERDTGGESYPGQAFFHEHNPRIKRAEENWSRAKEHGR